MTLELARTHIWLELYSYSIEVDHNVPGTTHTYVNDEGRRSNYNIYHYDIIIYNSTVTLAYICIKTYSCFLTGHSASDKIKSQIFRICSV